MNETTHKAHPAPPERLQLPAPACGACEAKVNCGRCIVTANLYKAAAMSIIAQDYFRRAFDGHFH